MHIYVQIYDNDGAYTIFYIPQTVFVYPDERNLILNMDKLTSIDPKFESNIILNEGSYIGSIQEIQRISSILNNPSLSDKLGLITNDNQPTFPKTYGPLANYSGVTPVNNLNV